MTQATSPGLIDDALQRAGDYLLGRETPSGGFCFYRWGGIEEPNLSDTDHALTALRLLGRTVPDPSTVRAFAARFRPTAQPDSLMRLLGIELALGRDPLDDPGLRRSIDALRWSEVPPADSTHVEGWLRRTRLVAALRQRVGLPLDSDRLTTALGRLMHGGGFGSTPNLIDTHVALEIADLCGRPLRRDDVRGFVDAVQIPAHGFTLTPSSRMGRLDLVVSGIACCHLLDLPVRHAADALNLVLACQAASGAFANAPGALPDIEHTHSGVVLLQKLVTAH